MGIDITQRAFWEGSLAVAADEMAQFEAVVERCSKHAMQTLRGVCIHAWSVF